MIKGDTLCLPLLGFWASPSLEPLSSGSRFYQVVLTPIRQVPQTMHCSRQMTLRQRTSVAFFDIDGNAERGLIDDLTASDLAGETTDNGAYADVARAESTDLYNEFFGSDGDDIADGQSGHYYLDGRGGDDALQGGDGDDHIHGGAGNDTLSGDVGDDLVYGYIGDDDMSGGTGDDKLHAGDGDDVIEGGSGSDELLGGYGDDTLIGGAGTDNMQGSEGNDVLDGVTGEDIA
jgi:Ca2+-binding RTX toxin-like protein